MPELWGTALNNVPYPTLPHPSLASLALPYPTLPCPTPPHPAIRGGARIEVMDPTPNNISGDGLLSKITAYPISGSLCARWTPRPERRCYVWDCGGLFSKERKGDSGACVGDILAVGVDALGGLPRPNGLKYLQKKQGHQLSVVGLCRCGLLRGPP